MRLPERRCPVAGIGKRRQRFDCLELINTDDASLRRARKLSALNTRREPMLPTDGCKTTCVITSREILLTIEAAIVIAS